MHVHLIGLLGCAPPDTPSQTIPDLPPLVEIGTGEVEFVPLEDGDTLDIVLGPQGGYHFTVSLRVQGIEAGNPDNLGAETNPTTVFRAYRDDLRVDMDASTYRQGIDASPEPGVYEMLGRRLILDIQDDAELDGSSCLIDVTVTDVNGIEVHDDREILAVPSPFN